RLEEWPEEVEGVLAQRQADRSVILDDVPKLGKLREGHGKVGGKRAPDDDRGRSRVPVTGILNRGGRDRALLRRAAPAIRGVLEQRHLLVPQLPRVPQRRLPVKTHGAEGVGPGEQAHGTRSGAAGLPERLDARETALARHRTRDLLGVILSKPLDAVHSEAKRRSDEAT